MSDKNRVRQLIRAEAKLNEIVEESLQPCLITQNRALLLDHISRLNEAERINHIKALLYVWDSLLAQIDGRTRSCMPFAEAYDVYIAFSQYRYGVAAARQDENLKKTFRTLLLHPLYGLRVLVIKSSWILLNPEYVDLENFVKFLHTDAKSGPSRDHLSQVMDLMETEWDRTLLRYLISSFNTRSQLKELGIAGNTICRVRTSVENLISSMSNIEEEAEVNVEAELARRKLNLGKELTRHRRLLSEKRSRWTEAQVAEKEEEMEDVQRKVQDIDKVVSEKGSKTWLARVARMRKKLIKEKRLSKRKLGSGRKRLVTEGGERFVAKCIEGKSTAHGRRHDDKLYVGRRVKKKDFLRLINQYQRNNNLPIVRSATTILNRGRAKNIKSIQAKRHIGLALFCCKKSPKSINRNNLLTHYCHAYKKNVIRFLHLRVDSGLVLYRSFDDKAYLCPETSTGMQSARSQRIYQTCENEPGFAHYDFPEKMVNVTPATFLYMSKQVTEDESGEEKISTTSYDSIVHIKPKYFVGSGNGVWASHLIENRHTEPHLHLVDSGNVDSLISFKLNDVITSFIIQTIREDAVMLGDGANFISYESKKLNFLQSYLSEVIIELQSSVTEGVVELMIELEHMVSKCSDLLSLVPELSGEEYWSNVSNLVAMCKEIKMNYSIPVAKPYIVDITDAGPGVGITNHEVGYRIVQEIMICGLDYYIRVHNAPENSSSNEVERIQSSIGDAVCDGNPLNWEYYERYAGMSEDEINILTLAELESLEYDRMHRNALKVCEEVNKRVDGAPTLEGFLKSSVSRDLEDLFFWDSKFLQSFIHASDANESALPGMHFYSKLKRFSSLHFRKAEKSLEFVKFRCEATGESCDYCTSHPWYDKVMESIPEPYPKPGTGSYFHAKDTPVQVGGVLRATDDYNPRVQLKILFNNGMLSLDDVEKIDEFAERYIVDKIIVLDALKEMRAAQVMALAKKKDRAKLKQANAQKVYADYDWNAIIEGGDLKKMLVTDLDKYIDYHALKHLRNKNKPQKIEGVKLHYMRNCVMLSDNANIRHYMEVEDSDKASSSSAMEVHRPGSIEKINFCGQSTSSLDMEADESDLSSNYDSSDDEVLIEINPVAKELITLSPVTVSDGSEDEEDEIANESDDSDGSFQDVSLFRTSRYGRTVGSVPKKVTYKCK